MWIAEETSCEPVQEVHKMRFVVLSKPLRGPLSLANGVSVSYDEQSCRP